MTVRIPLTEEQTQALQFAGAAEHSSTEADLALAKALSTEPEKLVFQPRDAGLLRQAVEALDAVGGMEEGFDSEHADEWARHCKTLAALAQRFRPYELSRSHSRGHGGYGL